jgi:hypothetical protein
MSRLLDGCVSGLINLMTQVKRYTRWQTLTHLASITLCATGQSRDQHLTQPYHPDLNVSAAACTTDDATLAKPTTLLHEVTKRTLLQQEGYRKPKLLRFKALFKGMLFRSGG